ncbi:DNA-directed RNA polymerase I subunit RPA43 [Smittium mucronatum]|uniref:DNA-directed RNA polymerase I subunit RPA43 n=1 Tax=Smittium mucronatum TaxID=133383 RepID=A0A1R0H296_9FUNG|nr:DNA-directed RNA polymerase I subunit RPA43 [Smittium mucronatum]
MKRKSTPQKDPKKQSKKQKALNDSPINQAEDAAQTIDGINDLLPTHQTISDNTSSLEDSINHEAPSSLNYPGTNPTSGIYESKTVSENEELQLFDGADFKVLKSSDFFNVKSKITITLAPVLLLKPETGVYETLNAMLLKYIPQLSGVLIAYNEVKYEAKYGKIMYDYPNLLFDVVAEFLIWRPMRGLVLRGAINIQSPAHIGILLYNTFNATIPKKCIDKRLYKWVEYEQPILQDVPETPTDTNDLLPTSEPEKITVKTQVSDSSSESDSENDDSTVPSTEKISSNTDEQSEDIVIDNPTSPKPDQDTHEPKRKIITHTGEWVNISTNKSIGSEGYIDFVVSE